MKNEKDAKHTILAQLALSSVDYVIKSINEIHQQELESALLLLPMQFLTEFMKACLLFDLILFIYDLDLLWWNRAKEVSWATFLYTRCSWKIILYAVNCVVKILSAFRKVRGLSKAHLRGSLSILFSWVFRFLKR